MNKVKFACLLLSVVMPAAVLLTSCEDDDEWDHIPPAGLGSMIVDNNSFDDLDVFVDGVQTNSVSLGNEKAYDLAPGMHRVVLQEEDGDRTFRDDIDILSGELTILDVSADPANFDDLRVVVTFE